MMKVHLGENDEGASAERMDERELEGVEREMKVEQLDFGRELEKVELGLEQKLYELRLSSGNSGRSASGEVHYDHPQAQFHRLSSGNSGRSASGEVHYYHSLSGEVVP